MYRKCFVLLGSLMMSVAQSTEIPRAYSNVAKLHGIPERILYSIALAESSRSIDGVVIPWPWTINVEGEGHYFDSRRKMLEFIADQMWQGKRSIDVGALQINLRYHHARFPELTEISIPEHNLNVASEILLEQYFHCDLDWWCAVGRYHSPNNRARADAYTLRVRKWYDRL